MFTYVIGDVQGCFKSLTELLKLIKFDSSRDQLIFAGDLVNRGPNSLDVLRFIKSLKNNAITVLGNHDLYLIAVFYKYYQAKKSDTFQNILDAPDGKELILWLRKQKFLYKHKNCVITHAGIPPNWSLDKAQQLSKELEKVLINDNLCSLFMRNLFNHVPLKWDESLSGFKRWICIANYFTRMRICNKFGYMKLDSCKNHNALVSKKNYDAWFNYTKKHLDSRTTLLFGHWSMLKGYTGVSNIIALDTGCVWNGMLSAYCIEEKKIFRVTCKD